MRVKQQRLISEDVAVDLATLRLFELNKHRPQFVHLFVHNEHFLADSFLESLELHYVSFKNQIRPGIELLNPLGQC